jgi:hypothetical protein
MRDPKISPKRHVRFTEVAELHSSAMRTSEGCLLLVLVLAGMAIVRPVAAHPGHLRSARYVKVDLETDPARLEYALAFDVATSLALRRGLRWALARCVLTTECSPAHSGVASDAPAQP